jgi:Tfp pilus assembly protein PilX
LARQRGFSMFIVMVILLLTLILVLGGLSMMNLNESLVGNQSDAQRAYGAAQALVDAAKRDIRLNGRYCNAGPSGQPTGNLGTTGPSVVNLYYTSGATPLAATSTPICTLRFPRNMDDYNQMLGASVVGLGHCASAAPYTGVCISNGPTNPNFTSATIDDSLSGAEQWSNGVNYTQYAGDSVDYGSGAAVGGGSVSLALGDADRGRYWVEVFPFAINPIGLGGSANAPAPDSGYPFVFRITAMAKGIRGGTVSVLRTYYMPYPATYH